MGTLPAFTSFFAPMGILAMAASPPIMPSLHRTPNLFLWFVFVWGCLEYLFVLVWSTYLWLFGVYVCGCLGIFGVSVCGC